MPDCTRYFVEPVMFLYFTAVSMEVSLVQQLIRWKVCLAEGMSNCGGNASPELIDASSPWIGWYNIVLSLSTLFTGLWFGSWAEKYGRKRLMIVSVVGSMLSTINFMTLTDHMRSPPICVLSSALISGLTCGSLGVSATCYGIVCEVTSPQRLRLRIAFMELVTFFGASFGFFVVGYLLPRMDLGNVFGNEFIILGFILYYIICYVHEPERPPAETSTAPVLSIQHVVSMYHAVTRTREKSYREAVTLVMISSFVLSLGLAASYQFTYTLLTSPPLSWDGAQYSKYHGLLIATQGCLLALLLPICINCFNMKSTMTGIIGTLSRMLGLGCLSLATETWIANSAIGLISMSEFAMPSLRSILSKIVGPTKKTQIFAFMGAMQSFAFFLSAILLVVPGSMTAVFPGLGMAIASGLQIVPFACLFYLYFTLDERYLPAPLLDDGAPESSESEEASSTTSQEVQSLPSNSV